LKLLVSILKIRTENIQRILLLLFFLSFAFVVAIIKASIVQVGISLLILFGFSLWGHVIVFPLYYKKRDLLPGFVWGSICGIAIASLITSVLVYLTGWNLPLIFCFTTLLPALALMLQLISIRTRNLPRAEPSHVVVVAMLCSLTIVTLFFFYPYKNLGVLVGNNYLYAWLFGHDFINRLVHIESLSRGMPLDGMFFSGEKLSYYWLAYVYPALLHNMKSVTLEVQQLLQLTQMYYSMLTTAALILFLKKYIQEKKIFLITVMLALCCYSYVWLINAGIRLLILASRLHPFDIDKHLVNFSGFSHGFVFSWSSRKRFSPLALC
jgi:hypothetical protein